MTRFFLDLISMTLLTAESITNGLKSRLGKIEEEKWSLAKRQILWNAYILLWRRLLLLRIRMTFALFGLFCWSFAGFLASFQYWFKSVLFIFITGTCFENLSIVLLKLFHLIFFTWQFTGCYMM